MKIPGMWRLPEAKRRLKNRIFSHATVLMYHRVIELPNDPFMLAVTPEWFDEQMEILRRHCTPIRLGQLAESLREGKVPKHSVVVTFDDGYADNFFHAYPILEKYEIPATVFVTAGQVGSRSEFWWDELDRLLLHPGTLPDRLELSLNGSSFAWELDGAAAYTEQDWLLDRDWHVEKPADPGPRQRLFRLLHDRLQPLSVNDRQKAIGELRRWAGASQEGRPTHRALTCEEAVLLDQSGLVELGAHTVNHPALGKLPLEMQREEIRQSKNVLERIVNHPVKSFALPHGSSTPQTISILQEEGFECACSSRPDTVRRNADLFQLPRLGVRNWDPNRFERWLAWWVDG